MKTIPEPHPIFVACRNGDAAEVKRLFEVDMDLHSGSLIATAIKGGSVEVARTFIERGFDLNRAFNDFGETPIFRAIEDKQLPLVEYFLEQGADANRKDGYGGPLLDRAAAGLPAALPLLLRFGADLNGVNNRGETAVFAAATGNKPEALAMLVVVGCGLDGVNAKGMTPLIRAAQVGAVDSVRWLLERTCRTDVRDVRGRSALDWARANRREAVVKLLEEAGAV